MKLPTNVRTIPPRAAKLAALFAAAAALVLALFAHSSAWADATPWEGAGTTDDPYLIEDATDLKALADAVNATTGAQTYAGTHFLITRDIDLTANASTAVWTPIGRSETRPFAGSVDGNGHTVTVKVAVGIGHAGLFGCVKGESAANRAGVSNLTVAGSVVTTGEAMTAYGVGAVCGYAENADFRNLSVTASVSIADSRYNVGGVLGMTGTSTAVSIVGCHSAGAVTGYPTVGGIVGMVSTPASGQNVIADCAVTGTVGNYNVGNAENVGAIMGRATFSQLGGTLRVSNCYSSAALSNSGSINRCYGVGRYSRAMSDGLDRDVHGIFLFDHCYALEGTVSAMYEDDGFNGPTATDVCELSRTVMQSEGFVSDRLNASGKGAAGAFRYAAGSYPELAWEVPAGAPCVTSQPQAISLKRGSVGTVNVAAENPGEGATSDGLSYQWYRSDNACRGDADDTAIEGACSATYSVPSGESGSTWYYCKVSNDFGSVLSDTARAVVWTDAAAVPVVTAPSTFVRFAQRSSFDVNTVNVQASRPDAAEEGHLSYQWYEALGTAASPLSDAPIPGATDAVLSIDMTQLGTRHYWCLVTNTTGPATNTATAQSDVITVQVDPLSIESPDALAALASQVSGGDSLKGLTVELAADLNMEGVALHPIGTAANPFRGNFLGQGHVVSNAAISGTSGVALFGSVAGASASAPCRIADFTLQGSVAASGSVAAGVAARAYNAEFSQVGCEMTITSGGGAYDYAGGIVGTVPAYSASMLSLDRCYFAGSISSGAYVGGILGYCTNTPSVAVSSCYARGSVSGAVAGGIVGASGASMSAYKVSVANCYAQGQVLGSEASGGVVGSGPKLTVSTAPFTITDTLASVLGPASSDGMSTSVAAVGANEAWVNDGARMVSASELQGESALGVLGEAFCADWSVANGGYPRLAWQPTPEGTVRIVDWSPNVTCLVGSEEPVLHVTALNPVGGTEGLAYQWFLVGAGDSLEAIDGAVSCDYAVSTSEADQGTRRFICRVGYAEGDKGTGHLSPAGDAGDAGDAGSAGDAGDATTVDSPVMSVTVYAQAVSPIISSEPADVTAKQFSTGCTLGVSLAGAQTGSTITYQWYEGASADDRDADAGAAIDGATGPTLDVSTREVGERFYWCTITSVVAVPDNRAVSTTRTARVSVVPFTVESADDFVELSQLVNGGESFAGAQVTLMDDVDLTAACENGSFSPIGTSEDAPFSGSFDGGGHTVTLALDRGTEIRTGLFGYMGDSEHTASLSNLVVAGSVAGGSWTGGIVGGAGNLVAANLRNEATVTSNVMKAGGIVGYVDGAIGSTVLSSCANAGDVTTTYGNVGGIAGYASRAYAAATLSIEDCYNVGDVSGTFNAGGIVGGLSGPNGPTLQMDRCYSAGAVEARTESLSTRAGALLGSPLYAQSAPAVFIRECLWLEDSAAGTYGTYEQDYSVDWGALDVREVAPSELRRSAKTLGGAYQANPLGFPRLAWEPVESADVSELAVSVACESEWSGGTMDAVVSVNWPDGSDAVDAACYTVQAWCEGEPARATLADDGTWHVDVTGPGAWRVVVSGDEDAGFTGQAQVSFTVKEAAPRFTFPDVQNPDDWFYDNVYRAAARGLITGYTDDAGNVTHFGPSDPLTRAQVAMILWRYFEPDAAASYRASGSEGENRTSLADVESGQWYTGAANWAVSMGVISGKVQDDGSRLFDPSGAITREQLCTIVARTAATFKGAQVEGAPEDKLRAMPDGDEVSAWARESVAWGLNSGVISGINRDGVRYVGPQEVVDRATMATVLMNSLDAGLL